MQSVPPRHGNLAFVRASRMLDDANETRFVGGMAAYAGFVTRGGELTELLGLGTTRTFFAPANPSNGRAEAISASSSEPGPQYLTNSPPVASFLITQGFALTGPSFRADAGFPIPNGFNPQDAVIEPLGTDGFVVIWGTSDGSGRGVFRQIYDSSASPVGPSVRVNNTTAGDQQLPEVAALTGGGHVVVWGGGDVFARRYDAAGVPVGTEFMVPTTTHNNEDEPVVAGLANGGFVVAWASLSGPVGEDVPKFQIYDSSGAPVGGETVLVDQRFASKMDVAPLPGGGFVASWLFGNDVYARTVAADGTLGAIILVADEPPVGGASDRTFVEILSGGGFVVAWESSAAGTLDVYARVYDDSFAPVGNKFRVNQTTTLAQENPSVAALPDGSFLVSWQSQLSTNDTNTFVRKFGADGTPITDEFALVTGAGHQRNPDLAAVGDKTYVLWIQSDGLFGQRFVPTFTGYQATEQLATNLKGSMGISDPDAGSSTMTVTLSVNYGIINVTAGSSGATIFNSGTGTVTIQGTVAQINALLATDATSALSYVPNTDTPPAGATLTFTVSDGLATGSASAPIAITVVEDLPTAVPDAAAVDENATVNIPVLANDTDPDGGTRQIVEVNGDPLLPGHFLQLASGAAVTLEFDGTFTYDPAGSFNNLAGNQTATDSFTYSLNGGSVTAVTVTIQGVGTILGDRGDNTVNGTPQNDFFDLSQGGNDAASGDAGDDGFYFGAAFTGADSVDGGAGSNDQIGLDGDYGTVGSPFVLGGNFSNVEVVVLMPGPAGTPNNFNFSVTDSAVVSGQSLTIFALQTSTGVVFDGSNEQDGAFKLYGGTGNDVFTGSGGSDWLFGSAGQDLLDGGAGADTFYYQAVSESTGPAYDQIVGFVSGPDKIDLPGTVAAIDSTVVGGALNSSSFNANLAAALQAAQLHAGDAVLFKPDSGTLAGTTFLVIDANGVDGYQADADYVVQLLNPPPILQSSDFI